MFNFDMQIKVSFAMADGSTVICGIIASDIPVVPQCECDLMRKGKVIASFRIDGEMLLKNKKSNNRAVSTRENVRLSLSDIADGLLKLRFKTNVMKKHD